MQDLKKQPQSFLLIKKSIKALLFLPASLIAMLVFLVRPIILLRIGNLLSSRLGHFAANTELYLCEKYSGKSTNRRFSFDFFYYQDVICNEQLNTMWKRSIVILPRSFSTILVRLEYLFKVLSGFFPFIGAHIVNTVSSDRDIYGLLDESPINLKFTKKEKSKGLSELIKLGVPKDSKVVLLCVRDNAYLKSVNNTKEWDYHNYRNSNIDNYVLAAEQLAKMGYYVIRMGVSVNKSLDSNNPKVIDYAFNGMRSEFMDIYLASICDFVISTGNGGDALAVTCFRKPSVFVNYCPILDFFTPKSNSLSITKHHISIENNKELSFKEIISNNVGSCQHSECFEQNGVILTENTPEEIRDVAIEMANRLSGSWNSMKIDTELQSRFWDIFPNQQLVNGKIHHGKINLTFGSKFLRDNAWWVE